MARKIFIGEQDFVTLREKKCFDGRRVVIGRV